MIDENKMYFAKRLNATPTLKWFEAPAHSNFLYEQYRVDPNIDNYDVELFVVDPTNDPLAAT